MGNFHSLREFLQKEITPFSEEYDDDEDDSHDDPEDCECEDEEDCDCDEFEYEDDEDLSEAKFIFKVNSRGKKTRKLRCKPGFRVASVGGRLKCVRVSGKEKMAKRRAIRKAVRTKKSKGSGYKKRVVFKQKRAIRKRKAMGLKNQRR